MRTTLNLDDDVPAAAWAKARSERISLGRVASEFARQGLAQRDVGTRGGFPVFELPQGHVITDDLVEQFRDDD